MNRDNKVDETLRRLVTFTHSPRMESEDGEAAYRDLKSRLADQPRQTGQEAKRGIWRRIAVVACVVIISGIGLAMVKRFVSDEDRVVSMTFREAPLRQILESVAEQYDVKVCVEEQGRADKEVTAEFRSDESLAEIMDALSAVGCFEYKISGDTIYVMQFTDCK